jgi:hypothetical protein
MSLSICFRPPPGIGCQSSPYLAVSMLATVSSSSSPTIRTSTRRASISSAGKAGVAVGEVSSTSAIVFPFIAPCNMGALGKDLQAVFLDD